MGAVVVLMASLGVLASGGPQPDASPSDTELVGPVATVDANSSTPFEPRALAAPPTEVAATAVERLLGSASDDPLGALESPTSTEAPTPVVTVPAVDIAPTSEGWELALGTTPAVGSGGSVITYRVEREPGIDVTMEEFLPTVVATLEDPERGWTATGKRQLQRVDGEAAIRVVLASPGTVDARCARAGLQTNGRFSCWVGNTAMLSVMRWQTGARDFTDIEVYRTYLVNHEVGHGLGMGHAGCAGAGALAPVMMQQTKSTGACVANGWPNVG